jgi:hypothetical protein
MYLPQWKWLRDSKRTSPDALLSFSEIRVPPVDVEYIVHRLGVHLHYVRNLGYAGAVESTPTQADIWVNRDDHPLRQRFTLAHEVGHLMLHALGKKHRDTNFAGINWEEVQANRFAADLLVPVWMLDLAIQSTGGEPRRLARLFDVSEQAMTYRLQNTGRI